MVNLKFSLYNRTIGNKTGNMSLQHVVENSELWGPLKKLILVGYGEQQKIFEAEEG